MVSTRFLSIRSCTLEASPYLHSLRIFVWSHFETLGYNRELAVTYHPSVTHICHPYAAIIQWNRRKVTA